MCVVLITGALLAGLGEVVDVTSSTYRGPSCRSRRGGLSVVLLTGAILACGGEVVTVCRPT